jgi:predicted AAA+ superfamily ATPase
MTEYHPRDITDAVCTALENMPVVVVTGMRQTGKTTFLCSQSELGDRSYVSFDDFDQFESAKSDPDNFIRRDKPLTIDEAHKCPEIFTAIKRAVDKERIPGQFLLSGPANFSILQNITASLAGRSVYLAIHPFNRREVQRQTASEPFIKQFFKKQEIDRNKRSFRSGDSFEGKRRKMNRNPDPRPINKTDMARFRPWYLRLVCSTS